MKNKTLVEVNHYNFSQASIQSIENNAFASGQWPLVYVLSDEEKCKAYIGETTDALTRMNTHLKHKDKSKLTTVHLITSDYFNKSATLDVESSLIKYMAADGKFELLNGNLGIVDHNYYQKGELYSKVFKSVWKKLQVEGIVKQSLESINNSDLFKYSPYKSLSFEQRQGLLGIMHTLLDDSLETLIVEGGAGTGKSVLAIFLFKLLQTNEDEIDFKEFSSEELEFRELLEQITRKYPNPSMALVVPMASFRKTLKKAFKNISGLKPNMVIGPTELAKNSYDIVLVDESHRLRKRKNLGSYFASFDKVCAALGFDKHNCSELDWVCKQSKKAVLFYDENQTIKPSDANTQDFIKLKSSPNTQVQKLISQFRVSGGNAYVDFVDGLLSNNLGSTKPFQSKKYEFELFDSFEDFRQVIQQKNKKFGLSRLIAGYAWPWISKADETASDITIEGVGMQWNRTNMDWINAESSEYEVGCIHTTQGYDLNYTGIIFGEEIGFDKELNEIVIYKDKYFDRNGKQSISDPKELKQYILNIYKTIMLRGIKGTFIYACNPELREYLARYIPMTQKMKNKTPEENHHLKDNVISIYPKSPPSELPMAAEPEPDDD